MGAIFRHNELAQLHIEVALLRELARACLSRTGGRKSAYLVGRAGYLGIHVSQKPAWDDYCYYYKYTDTILLLLLLLLY